MQRSNVAVDFRVGGATNLPLRRARKWMLAGIFVATVLALSAPRGNAQDIQCTFNANNISFGSIDVSTGKPFDAMGTFTYSCTGESRQVVRICPSWDLGDNPYMLDGSGHKLMFNLYADESHATVWSTWFGRVKGPTIDVPLGRSEKGVGTAMVYAQIAGGQQSVPAGSYRASVGGGHVSIDYDSATTGSCDVIKHSRGIQRVSFSITATVKGGVGSDASSAGAGSGSPMDRVKRGMKIEEVTTLLGAGKELSSSVGDGGLKTQVIEYLSSDRKMDITYVDGLVVRFAITSK